LPAALGSLPAAQQPVQPGHSSNEKSGMKIVCCSTVAFGKEAFSTLGDVEIREGRKLRPCDVSEAEMLVVRSTARIGKELLEGSRIGFVGTATIGFDHMDTSWLDASGIRWCHAPGCNAVSVAEYVVAALLVLGKRHGFRLRDKTIGVVGVGNVGSRVAERCERMGMRVLRNDPPLERRLRTECPEKASAFVALEQLLAESDIITLHVPLEKRGEFPTWRMANGAFLGRMKRGAVLINSARGAVVETDALIEGLRSGRILDAAIDTWEGEPSFRADLLERISIGTPHIAGYSFDGKVNGTAMVYRAACAWAGRQPVWAPEAVLPKSPVPVIEADGRGRDDEDLLMDIVSRVYDIMADDTSMRAIAADPLCADPAERGRRFDLLRNNYRIRREFRFTTVKARNIALRTEDKIRGLGFEFDRG